MSTLANYLSIVLHADVLSVLKYISLELGCRRQRFCKVQTLKARYELTRPLIKEFCLDDETF